MRAFSSKKASQTCTWYAYMYVYMSLFDGRVKGRILWIFSVQCFCYTSAKVPTVKKRQAVYMICFMDWMEGRKENEMHFRWNRNWWICIFFAPWKFSFKVVWYVDENFHLRREKNHKLNKFSLKKSSKRSIFLSSGEERRVKWIDPLTTLHPNYYYDYSGSIHLFSKMHKT